MRFTLTPIETRPTQNASRSLGTSRYQWRGVDAQRGEPGNAGFSEDAGVPGQLNIAVADESIADRNSELAGKMVVTGPGPAERGFLRSDGELFAAWCEFGRHLHDAFEHLSD